MITHHAELLKSALINACNQANHCMNLEALAGDIDAVATYDRIADDLTLATNQEATFTGA